MINTVLRKSTTAVKHAITQLRDYQLQLKEQIQLAWQQGNENVLAVLPTGGGKCLGKDTPVLMYDGRIVPVQDVKQGDLLMGPDSQPRTVLTTCTGSEMLYRVTPAKGDPYVVNESHILSLKQTGLASKPKYESQKGKGRVVNIEVRDYLKSSNNFKHTHKGWRAGVNWHTKQLPEILPPYLLGLWLGDGSSRTASITTADLETAAYLSDFTQRNAAKMRVELLREDNRACTFHIGSKGAYESILDTLRGFDLLQNKHIPLAYKTGSKNQRLQLLAGLIDSDGYLYHSNCYGIVQKRQVLANDVAYLARSLGFAAYVSEVEKTCTNTQVKGTYYSVSISGDTYAIPVKIKRKKAKPRKQKKDVLVTGIKSVEPIGVGDYYGFEIDGDRLFMLGDFTVTHNTVVLSHVILEEDVHSIVLAHRRELVEQISMALARNGVRHRILAPSNVVKQIVKKHVSELGYQFYDPSSKVGVASVDTVNAQAKKANTLDRKWFESVRLWVQDEAHHVLKSNKWGKCLDLFPNAIGLGVTATPERADGKGLGRHADGVFDCMVEGPTMRWLITQGYLVDYRIICSENHLQLAEDDITATGDYSQKKNAKAIKNSTVIGDIVVQYEKWAAGKRAVTFVPDVDNAIDTADRLNKRGFPSQALSAKSSDIARSQGVKDLASGKVLQLVNVDLFGEGFDLPAIDCVQFARPTMSYGLYVQQFGRVLRPVYAQGYDLSTREGRLAAIAASAKPYAMVIDHVGNVIRHHGPPDRKREWTLDARERRSSGISDNVPLIRCLNPMCMAPYERYEPCCPYCGTPKPEPEQRNGPEFVDGDLVELDPDTLARMRGEEVNVDLDSDAIRWKVINARVPERGVNNAIAAERKNIAAQRSLRGAMDWWSGWQMANGLDTESKRMQKFYYTFGTDVSSARALKARDAELLQERIFKHMGVGDA